MHRALRFLCVFALVLPAIPASAQTAATQAAVKIENYALVIAKQNDLNFAEGGPSQQLDGSGIASFRVGATVFIQAAQRPGTYTGSFNVTVAYN